MQKGGAKENGPGHVLAVGHDSAGQGKAFQPFRHRWGKRQSVGHVFFIHGPDEGRMESAALFLKTEEDIVYFSNGGGAETPMNPGQGPPTPRCPARGWRRC